MHQENNKPIIFFDIDGTLLNSDHQMLYSTKLALKQLQAKGIPFAIVSARSPSGIYPILEENNFNCNIISYSGALILDEKRNILKSIRFSRNVVKDILNFINVHMLDCTPNIYVNDTWIVLKKDKRVKIEEAIVKTSPIVKPDKPLEHHAFVNKMLLICGKKNEADRIENMIKNRYPSLSVVKSTPTQIEVMGKDINKGQAIRFLCRKKKYNIHNSIAFGDNFNDLEMLQNSNIGVVMGNAPDELKKKFEFITDSNDNDGIYKALAKMGIVE